MTLLAAEPSTWTAVCGLHDLEPGRGVAALVDCCAVALFRLEDDAVAAVDNIDPCSGASVLSRGLVGHTVEHGRPLVYVASPIRKQRFDLATGRCLDAAAAVTVWPVRVLDGLVEVGTKTSHSSNEHETNQ